MKRSLSDSDSESLFEEHDGLKSSSPSQSCHVTDRKRRRGVIEKRRRDRINNSLSELRRLVPSAFEKQGSAKLEKAEILQMTVDHLKILHQKGANGYNYHDPHSLAIDYRSIGYRECAAEVARYLVAVEGMDLQDPLRLRLLSHLQCFSAQREVVAKASTLQNNSWNNMQSMSSHHGQLGNQYVNGSGMSSMSSMLTSHNNNQSDMNMNNHTSHQGISSSTYSDSRVTQSDIPSGSLHNTMRLPTSVNMPLSGQMSNMNSSGVSQPVSPSLIPPLHGQFGMPLNSMQSIMTQNQGQNYNNGSPVKPYRPWGGEIAY